MKNDENIQFAGSHPAARTIIFDEDGHEDQKGFSGRPT